LGTPAAVLWDGNIPVPEAHSVELQPGALHVMPMTLNKDLKTDGAFLLTLKYQKAGNMTGRVRVRSAT
jgi:copper(I)-binding protein